MNPLILLAIAMAALCFGSALGYYARQSIAKRQLGTIEQKIQKKVAKTKQEVEKLVQESRAKASAILEKTEREEDQKRQDLIKTSQLILRREAYLEKKSQELEEKEQTLRQKVVKLKQIKQGLQELQGETSKQLENIAKLSSAEAKEELFKNIEREYELEVLEKTRKLEQEVTEKLRKRAKEILVLAIQKCAIDQTQETTTTTVSLPSEDIKGRIIGKEGRNIKAFERFTGVEMLIDDTPGTVVLSAFDPIRREVAKIALTRLIEDGRIQPVRIEEIITKAQSEITSQIKEAGELAVYETGVVGLHPKIVQLLGRLKFRTSYGQNVLLHSIEVSHLAAGLAGELKGDIRMAKKAGLLHDIGKSVDHQIQGTHTDIGIKILEKFGVEQEIIDAMKSHHEEYPYTSLESILVQVADQISGARPGARKDTLENYLKRLEELEEIATSFAGVDKAYAVSAGREIRVFVNSELVSDLDAMKLAKEIANRIQEELKYPGEIKVTLLREKKIIEYAR